MSKNFSTTIVTAPSIDSAAAANIVLYDAGTKHIQIPFIQDVGEPVQVELPDCPGSTAYHAALYLPSVEPSETGKILFSVLCDYFESPLLKGHYFLRRGLPLLSIREVFLTLSQYMLDKKIPKEEEAFLGVSTITRISLPLEENGVTLITSFADRPFYGERLFIPKTHILKLRPKKLMGFRENRDLSTEKGALAVGFNDNLEIAVVSYNNQLRAARQSVLDAIWDCGTPTRNGLKKLLSSRASIQDYLPGVASQVPGIIPGVIIAHHKI